MVNEILEDEISHGDAIEAVESFLVRVANDARSCARFMCTGM